MTEQLMRQNLIVIAQCYATAVGHSLSTVSKAIHGNQSFFEKYLRGEVSPTTRTYFQMVNRFRESWPKPIEWEKVNEGKTLMTAQAADRRKLSISIPKEGVVILKVDKKSIRCDSVSDAKRIARDMTYVPWPETSPLPKLGKKVDESLRGV